MYVVIYAIYDPSVLTVAHSRLNMAFFGLLGLVAGVVAVSMLVRFERQAITARLAPDELFGLKTSLGPVPTHRVGLPRCEPPYDVTRARELPHVGGPHKRETADFLALYMARFATTHPGHVAVVQALLDIFEHHDYLPATHDANGHGGNSLQAHSVLVAYHMHIYKSRYQYAGVKLGGRLIIKLLDPLYKFEPDDPLIELLGLAHDIGKIDCYEYAPTDTQHRHPINTRKDHDLTGARALARIPEIWDLPEEDRLILLMVVGHYHHMNAMPMTVRKDSHELVVFSDRLHALAELLIQCDTTTSAVETRHLPFDAAMQDVTKIQNYVSDFREEADQIWSSVQEVLSETGRINGRDKSINLGLKCFLHQYRTHLIFIREDMFMAAIAQKMGLAAYSDPHGYKSIGSVKPSDFTMRVMAVLENKGVLFYAHDVHKRPAYSRLYRVDFYERKKYFLDKEETRPRDSEDLPKAQFSFGSTVIIQVETEFPHLKDMPDAEPVALPRNSRFGSMGKGYALQEDMQPGEGDTAEADPPSLRQIEQRAREAIADMEEQVDGSLATGAFVGAPPANEITNEHIRKATDLAEQMRKDKAKDRKQAPKSGNTQTGQSLMALHSFMIAAVKSGRFRTCVDTSLSPQLLLIDDDPIVVLNQCRNPMTDKTWENILAGKLHPHGFMAWPHPDTGKMLILVSANKEVDLLPPLPGQPGPAGDNDNAEADPAPVASSDPVLSAAIEPVYTPPLAKELDPWDAPLPTTQPSPGHNALARPGSVDESKDSQSVAATPIPEAVTDAPEAGSSGSTFFDDEPPATPHLTAGMKLRNALEDALAGGRIECVTLEDGRRVLKDSAFTPLAAIGWVNPEITWDRIANGDFIEEGIETFTSTQKQKSYVALKSLGPA